mgnify:CR=1 FL=1
MKKTIRKKDTNRKKTIPKRRKQKNKKTLHKKKNKNKKRIRSGFSLFSPEKGPSMRIKVDWNSKDKGYTDLTSESVRDYVEEIYDSDFNLIQTKDDTPFYCDRVSTINLQTIQWHKWNKIAWDDIECEEYNKWVKVSPCDKGKDRHKIFLKYKSNKKIAGFGIYLFKLHEGKITEEEHIEFVEALQKTFNDKPIYIHNQDLHWFHIKEYYS